MIEYHLGRTLVLEQVIELYRASRLGQRRPIDEPERMRQMLALANLVVTAWDGERLVGIARSLSDFCFCTYLADLAVDAAYQRHGIGKELMRRTQLAGGRATVFLFAAPDAASYYPHVGLQAGSGWLLRETERIP